MPSPEIHELTLPDSLAGERLDVALAHLLPQYSRVRLQRWIDEGRVRIRGVVPTRRAPVRSGVKVRIETEFVADDRVSAGAPAVPFRIVYRDAAIFVIDKPAGLVVHPGAGVKGGTLQNALLELDPKLNRVPRAGIVHRLDKDTSGLLVVARTPAAQATLVRVLAERNIGREYLALCQGVMTGGGTINDPIGRHRTQRIRMAVRSDGREAITHYRIERRFGAHTLVRVQLETGRTHQIRVHLAHIGHPVVGDPIYGGRRGIPASVTPAVRGAVTAFTRQALHAARLGLRHPTTGREVSFESPLPKDLTKLLKILSEGGATTEGGA